MHKKINLAVGIAAYNCERNIEHLLKILLAQREIDFTLKKVIVHSDSSTDNTVRIARSFKNTKILVIDNKKRKGFAGSVKTLLKLANQKLTVLLNDDIKIKDKTFINKLVQPFINEKNVGLVCGHPQPLKPINFIESAVVSSFRAYDKMRLYINKGNSEYSCDGKVLVLSNQFVNRLAYPANLNEMGNTDSYIYFSCIRAGFAFRFIRDAIVYYRNPSKYDDFVKWFSRNNSNRAILRKRFGKVVDEEFYKPPLLFWWCMLPEFIKNPLGCLFIFFTRFYIRYTSKKYSNNFNPKWEVISTTKDL